MGQMIYIQVEHDDWCLIWMTGDSSKCNCNPGVVPVEVTGKNIDEVAKLAERNERRAQELLRSKRN